MKQELLDDLQRLLKCPKPKTECADRALLDGALSGWKDEAYDLKRELNNGDPTDAKWLERPIKVEMLPRGLSSLCLDNSGNMRRNTTMRLSRSAASCTLLFTIMRGPTLRAKTETPTSLRCARWRRYGCRSKKGVTVIEKEDIKIGLEFILPIRLREYEEEVARFRHRQIMGEDCPVLPRYRTDLETLEGFKIIATVGRPFFKVVDSPREYFETSSKPHHLGSFVRVTCDEIENEVFYLSTKDIMERGETLIQKKKVESKEGVVTMINREDIKEGLKFKMPNNKIERKYQVASFRGATDMCEFIQYLTTLKTPRGDKNYVTLQVPLFEVCGGPKPISSADKKDQHCSWVGEYIKVRSDAIWKKPFYISLSDVMQHGLVDNKTLKDVLRNEREGKSTRLIPKKCVAFRDITNDMYDTFKAKNHDYDNSFSELFAECGMTYAYGHLSEKLKRVKSLMSDEAKVKGESMRDSLLDLANYAILTIMELDKTKK